MRVRDLTEPLRVGVEGIGWAGVNERAVHYVLGSGSLPLCGHDPELDRFCELDDDAPEWVGTDDVCPHCVAVAAGLLRWWYPRAKLPEWAQ